MMGVLWEIAKYLYILTLPHLDLRSVYGPFEVSVGLILWAFLSGLLLLAGAYVSATRHALREARAADLKRAGGSRRVSERLELGVERLHDDVVGVAAGGQHGEERGAVLPPPCG